MSLTSFIQAMPKVELDVHLEGAVQAKTLLMIADRNEIRDGVKHFDDWVRLLTKPDFKRFQDLVRMVSTWLTQPEDLARIAYDVGYMLSQQQVRYAEVRVIPSLYDSIGLSLDDFMAAINDGRDRAKRAWGIQLAWILTIPRDEPRRADDYARYAATNAYERSGIVGLGLSGREEVQPAGQFERAFRMAEKKGVPRSVRAGDGLMAEGILAALEVLAPNRLQDARGLLDSPEALSKVVDQDLGVVVSMKRAVTAGWISNPAEFPLRQMYDEGIRLCISTDMPQLYGTSIVEEYHLAVERAGLSIDELEELALNGVRASFAPPDVKAELLERFTADYAALRSEHLSSEQTA
ncbi:MAG: hypothetical protein SNJ59_13740 [Aggregatilineales bacterium]